jgi:hypothetical protein
LKMVDMEKRGREEEGGKGKIGWFVLFLSNLKRLLREKRRKRLARYELEMLLFKYEMLQ